MGVARCSLVVVLAASPTLAAAVRADGQSPPMRGVVDAAVTDSALAPLANATATLLGTHVAVTAGPDGRFRIVDLAPRDYIIIVRRIGYAPLSSVVRVPASDTVRVTYMLAPLTTTLDTVVVSERSVPARLAEFEERRRAAHGQFMTEERIEALNYPGMLDVLRTFRYVTINTGRLQSLRAGCPMTFYVDGVHIPSPDLDRGLPSPHEIAGIEVYVNSGDIPPQYKSFGRDLGVPRSQSGSFCGVVLLWTRSGT